MDSESTVDKLFQILTPSELSSGRLLYLSSAIAVLSVMQSVMTKLVYASMQDPYDPSGSSEAAYQAYVLVWKRAQAMVNY